MKSEETIFPRVALENPSSSLWKAYPYDAKPYLDKSRVILKDILGILKEIKILEENLLKMTKLETKLLNKEKEVI